MATQVIVPKMEMSQESATLIEWLKKEGEPVKKGDPLFVVETDKVTVEIESPETGILAEVSAQPGETMPVTTCIAYILQPGEAAPSSSPMPGSEKSSSTDDKQPHREATPLAARIASAKGLSLEGITGSGPGGRITSADLEKISIRQTEKMRASPAARRKARQQGVDLSQVSGSGPRGRIQVEDVLAFARQSSDSLPKPSDLQTAKQETQEYTVIPLQGMRRIIAERMVASYQNAPHVTLSMRVDLSNFEATRKLLNELAEKNNETRITVTGLLIKLTAQVLTRHPLMNARYTSTADGSEIHLMTRVNVGMAVALADGLIVPVIHDADRKPGREIAAEVQALTEKAHQNKLTPEDVAGGTFTITNLGPFGIEQFTAILYPGQTGILAVGAAVQEPVAVGEQVQIRLVAHLTLSVDHRVVDGAVAAYFMADLKALLEMPSLSLW